MTTPRSYRKAVKIDMITAGHDLTSKLLSACAAGFDGVELNHPGPYRPQIVRAATSRTGLPVPGIVNAAHWQLRLSDSDPQVRNAGRARLVDALHYAHDVGASSVLLVPGVVDDVVTFNECWQRSTEQIRRALPTAEQYGLNVLIENVWNGFLTDPTTLAHYVDSFSSDHVAVQFDIGNAVRYSPPEHWISVLGRRIRKIDVKDFASDNRQFDVALLDGDVNWQRVMAALDEIKYSGWMSAELPLRDQPDWLTDVAARMDHIIAI